MHVVVNGLCRDTLMIRRELGSALLPRMPGATLCDVQCCDGVPPTLTWLKFNPALGNK